MTPRLLLPVLAAALLGGSAAPAATMRTAVFAGGCFWSVEHEMEALPGVVDVVSGYAGGTKPNPTYRSHAGHLEAVKVTYDPARTSYARLVDGFLHRIDPTDGRGQICDYGASYRPAVFVAGPEERAAAQAAFAKVAGELKRPVAVAIRPAATFWKAEAYHQDYARRNPGAYADYKRRCGREAHLKALWGARYRGLAAAARTAPR